MRHVLIRCVNGLDGRHKANGIHLHCFLETPRNDAYGLCGRYAFLQNCAGKKTPSAHWRQILRLRSCTGAQGKMDSEQNTDFYLNRRWKFTRKKPWILLNRSIIRNSQEFNIMFLLRKIVIEITRGVAFLVNSYLMIAVTYYEVFLPSRFTFTKRVVKFSRNC